MPGRRLTWLFAPLLTTPLVVAPLVVAALVVAQTFAAGRLSAAEPEPELTKTDATGVLSRMVHDMDGREIGRVVDVVVDPAGQPRAIVVDVGGFMGVGSRRVAVSWASVHVPPPSATDPHVAIDLTDAQVRAAPDYNDRSKPAVVVGPPTTDPAPAPAAAPGPPPAPAAPGPPTAPAAPLAGPLAAPPAAPGAEGAK